MFLVVRRKWSQAITKDRKLNGKKEIVAELFTVEAMVAEIFITSMAQHITFVCVSICFLSLHVFFFSLRVRCLSVRCNVFVYRIEFHVSHYCLVGGAWAYEFARRLHPLLLGEMSFPMFKAPSLCLSILLCAAVWMSAWLSFSRSLCTILSDPALSTSTTITTTTVTVAANDNTAYGHAMLMCALFAPMNACHLCCARLHIECHFLSTWCNWIVLLSSLSRRNCD